MNCGEVDAALQGEMSRFVPKSAQVAERKTVACGQRCFAQVLISRTLSVCGEVAEWPKAAVC
jgi:hypothetical protein